MAYQLRKQPHSSNGIIFISFMLLLLRPVHGFNSLKLPNFPGIPSSTKSVGATEELLQACRLPSTTRDEIESLIDKLKPRFTDTASSPLMQKKWMLQWTTEKEINFFVDVGWTKERNSISQTIAGSALTNLIPLGKDFSFGVEGDLTVSTDNPQRTEFCFTTACLDLGKLGRFNFPPLGKGWFDTVYLDENLRVDVNSRDDILICTPAAAE